MHIHNLFPIPVAFFDLQRPLTDSEREFIVNQKQRPNMGNTSSENNYLLESQELSELKQFFQNSVDDFFYKVHSPKTNVSLRITQAWSNYTKPGGFHHKHSHPNSLISGVFYVQTDPEKDRIYFYKDGYQQIKLKTESYNEFNSESWWFEAVPNKLILFPSSLTHMVEALPNDAKTRISLSFNTFPIGNIGDALELTELIV